MSTSYVQDGLAGLDEYEEHLLSLLLYIPQENIICNSKLPGEVKDQPDMFSYGMRAMNFEVDAMIWKVMKQILFTEINKDTYKIFFIIIVRHSHQLEAFLTIVHISIWSLILR